MGNISLNEIPERSIDFAEKYLFPLCEEIDQENIKKALFIAKEEGKLISFKLLLKNGRIKQLHDINYIKHQIEKTSNYIKAICYKYKIFYEQFK